MAFWGVHNFQQYDKDLGLSLVIGRAKNKDFSNLKHKVWLKLQSWNERLLSQGGRKFFIKAVAMSIPTYTMSCLKLPRNFMSWKI